MIEQKNRDEFQQIGRRQVERKIDASLYDAKTLTQAYEWLDEQQNGPERAYKARVFRMQVVNTIISVLALVIAFLALLKK